MYSENDLSWLNVLELYIFLPTLEPTIHSLMWKQEEITEINK